MPACVQSLNAQDINEARDFIENERYSSAEELLESTISTAGSNSEAGYLLVKTYLEQDKAAEAKEFAESYLRPATKDPLSQIAYARYLLSRDSKNKAVQIFSSLLTEKKNQRNPSLLMAMAEAMIDADAGDASLAIEWLNMAAKRDRNNPQVDLLKGQAYRKLSDGSNAFLAYEEALKKDRDNVKAHYLLAKIFIGQKNPEIYMPHLLKAYELDSNFAPVLEELYNHYYYRDITLAKKYMEMFIANSDYNLRNDYAMTDLLYLNKEYTNAIQSAKKIIQNAKEKSQPRLYKLMAYSFAGLGDSASALTYINTYFSRNDPGKNIAADFGLRALLTARNPGAEKEAIVYYEIAAEMDTARSEKAKYAGKVAGLYKKIGEHSGEARWLGKLYYLKQHANNIDLFNWGLAHYKAAEYQQTDSVFGIYTTRYPEDIYGYYWRAQANAAIDTSMTMALAIPFYTKVVEIGEKNKVANSKMLTKSYGYLGGYEANITKDYRKSLDWFERFLEIDAENAEVRRYGEMLKNWIAEKK